MYLGSEIVNSRYDMCKFWGIIKTLTLQKSTIFPDFIILDDTKIENSEEIVLTNSFVV